MASLPGMGFTAWAGTVGDLCGAIEALQPLAAAVGAPDPQAADWHGALFGKLRPQVSRDPLLVAAVCGGTNTGKSLVANTLVGAAISRSVPEAARTRHPVASLPRGLATRIDLAALFPGFAPTAWTSDEDAITLGPDAAGNADRLVWREDAGGRQPERLVLLDTPDIDGTLRENWHRAELVRDACDVIVAVLTQQKYNDAAVRDFFAAAAAARKAVIVVFNMVDWPGQREKIAGWLGTFTAETGVRPLAVYAVPHDFRAAEAGTITFRPLAELTPDRREVDLAVRLADCDFDRIKLDAMAGALAVVLDPRRGVGSWLDAFEATARQWHETRRLLEQEARVQVDLPSPPREIVWNEIWEWLEPRRSAIDLTVSRGYRMVGDGAAWVARRAGLGRTESERRDDFAAVELAALKQALGDFVQRLEDTCRRDPRLAEMLGDRLVEADRTEWYRDLERRHAALPLVSDDYRAFVRAELERFAATNPGTVKALLNALTMGSVVRPVMTVALLHTGAVAVPAAAGILHHVLDYGVTVIAPLAGEGVVAVAASQGVRPRIERLFAHWSAERGRVLAETLHAVVLGDRLAEIDRLAAAATAPEVDVARRLVEACGRHLGTEAGA